MNIIDCVSRNLFLKKLFPEGLVGDVLLGQINFSVTGRMDLNIHTQQKPAVETSKWGTWGKDYNVIVVELAGYGGKHTQIDNWRDAAFAPATISQEEGIFVLTQRGATWFIKLDVDNLIFQNCSTYIL